MTTMTNLFQSEKSHQLPAAQATPLDPLDPLDPLVPEASQPQGAWLSDRMKVPQRLEKP